MPVPYLLVDDETLIQHVKSSTTWEQVAGKCGYKTQRKHGSPYCQTNTKTKMQNICDAHGVSYSHLKGVTVNRKWTPLNELKKKKRGTSALKRKLLMSDRLYICEWCLCENMDLVDGEWIWNGKKLTLQVDHIKGREHEDVNSLRFLCPSCHTQTANHTTYSDDPLHPIEDGKDSKQTHRKKIFNSDVPYICNACQCCHYTKEYEYWLHRDWPLNLEVNHINGRRIDNPHDLSNLEFLCPNCHTQHTNENVKRRQEETRARKKQNLPTHSFEVTTPNDPIQVVCAETQVSVLDHRQCNTRAV